MQNRLVFAGLAAALLLTPVVASAAAGDHHHGKLLGLFTPEQRVMFVMGARDQVKDMTPEQRHAWRHDQVAKVVAMPAPEQAKLKADLQARWDALPQDRKDRIEQRIAMRQQRHQDGTDSPVFPR
jgi:hypothetical protein